MNFQAMSSILRNSFEPEGKSQLSSRRRDAPIRSANWSRVMLSAAIASRKKSCWGIALLVMPKLLSLYSVSIITLRHVTQFYCETARYGRM